MAGFDPPSQPPDGLKFSECDHCHNRFDTQDMTYDRKTLEWLCEECAELAHIEPEEVEA
jgi:recombinational DNA repair protein (RecF pathway)